MGMITTKMRDHLAQSTFAIPSERKYPIPDLSHARDALARVAANGTPAQQAEVRRAVHRKFPSINVGGMKKGT